MTSCKHCVHFVRIDGPQTYNEENADKGALDQEKTISISEADGKR